MKEIAISEFKAKCLALLERVNTTKQPLRITRFGKAIAEVIPPAPSPPGNWLGSMADSLEVIGEIVSPAVDEEDWEALRD